MNQILENREMKLYHKKIYIIQFFIIIVIIIFLFLYYFWEKYSQNKLQEIAKSATSSYSISKLYTNNFQYNYTINNNSALIIGTIEIPKINISYPILSEYTENLLKISVCKFYGPNVNSAGNLCILGHNYNNEAFFSKLYLLEKNDVINIYTLNSYMVSYYIYNIYEAKPDNIDYISQETNR